MTPYQLSLCVKDYNEQKKAVSEEKLILTYLGAYWTRVKRMPNLKKLLGVEPTKKKMTPEEILAEVKALNASLGGSTY